MPDAVLSQLEGEGTGGTEDTEYRGGGGGRGGRESGREEKGLTDGESQIDKEKQGLVLSQFYFASFRLPPSSIRPW